MRNARVGIVWACVCLAWASSACSAPERTLTVRLQSDYGAQHEARYAEAPDGEVLSGPVDDTASPRITGLGDSTIPSPSPDTLTRFTGRFTAALPAGAGTFRIEAWGLERVGDPPLLLACEEVFVDGIDDGVTIAPLGPVRSDYVAESGCLRP